MPSELLASRNVRNNRAIGWVVILIVVNMNTIVVGLLFIFSVRAVSQESANSEKNANELARSVLQNEVKAEANDHSHWTLKMETEKPRRKEVDAVVQTKDGDLKWPLSINGRPLTAKQEHDVDEQTRRLTSDSNALQRSLKAQNDDAVQTQRLLKMLPEALIFRFGERRGDAVQVHFTPNPHFRPATREAQVFQAMDGDLWVDSKQGRLMEVSGHLTREVKFGGGLLGHLNPGGKFEVKQTEVAPGHWELTLLNVDMKGKALFFKTISVEQKVRRSDFHQVSDELTVAEAANLLRKHGVVGGSAGHQ
jgi:hypothetical protein